MAKRHCRTSDRHAAPRMPGPDRCIRRGAFAPCGLCLCGLLQSNASASCFAEGCAVTTSHPTSRQHRRPPTPWWITSPIRPDTIFGKDTEIAALRQQVFVLQRNSLGRVPLTNGDRTFFVLLYRWFPSILQAMTIVRPETVVRWHRAGLRRYWRWKSRRRGGRPPIQSELRALIRRMSVENVLWGAPRIQCELLKLGFVVAPARSDGNASTT
jgi:hypothetical protein